MPISSKKITNFTKTVSQLADKPNQSGLTAAQVKAQIDSSPEELRVAFNGLIDILLGTVAGDSGAKNIGSEAIAGVTGTTVYDQLADIKAQLNNATTGSLPDGSITEPKLAVAVATKLNQIASKTDLGKVIVGNGIDVDSAGKISLTDLKTLQENWIAPTLLNAWVNYGGTNNPNAGYYKNSLGEVYMRGMIKSGTSTVGTVLFNLPAGYRPVTAVRRYTYSWNGSQSNPAYILINPNGDVTIDIASVGNTYLIIDLPSFRAEQ